MESNEKDEKKIENEEDVDRDKRGRDGERRKRDDERGDHGRSGRSHKSRERKGRKGDKSRSRKRSGRGKRRRRTRSPSSSRSSSSSSSSSDSAPAKKKIVNTRLLAKLAARGETLEERESRRRANRAAVLESTLGYTAENNPFNDVNLHETFSWKKKEENEGRCAESRKDKQSKIFEEVEKVRRRRLDREIELQEKESRKAEESRTRELEKYDEWARKEEEFHLGQQRQRSAIRLVEGREKAVDVLAKNILLFGLTQDERESRSRVKYKEKYNALDELENLEVELQEPYELIKNLKLDELLELHQDIDKFRSLENHVGDGNDTILQYWLALEVVTQDEVTKLQKDKTSSNTDIIMNDIKKMFCGKNKDALDATKDEIIAKIKSNTIATQMDQEYWKTVLHQVTVYRAKAELSDIHSKMLVQQLESLEKRKDALSLAADKTTHQPTIKQPSTNAPESSESIVPVGAEQGNLEEELGLTDEILLGPETYTWQDKYRPRKPRYFNRVKTGYDWNKYNQTHYDHDNPPPKIVQGYKFNVFYPDLIDNLQTPQYFLERADNNQFCILRFHAGPPYEDVAFKIINREWNKARKRGFRSTFERGVLSLYFNFNTHWYRR